MAMGIQYSFERYEKKYFLTPAQKELLLSRIHNFVRADIYDNYSIGNIYYDTEDWRLIRASIEKPAYKEKLRVRSYDGLLNNGTVFAELKKKCCGVVYKRRILTKADEVGNILGHAELAEKFGQIGKESQWFQSIYQTYPRVFIGYDREAYSGIYDPGLRITFDTNMRWRDTDLDLRLGNFGDPIIRTECILMEIKIPGVFPLWLGALLSELGIFPISFSKYGTCYRTHILNQPLKKCENENKKEAHLCA